MHALRTPEVDRRSIQEFRLGRHRKPDFLVIGAMKGGTTALFNWLKEHPQFALPKVKEPWFFVDDGKWERGARDYLNLFEGIPVTSITGEASTGYSFLSLAPRAAYRISQTLPHVKLIFLARHPVSRLRSHYRHEVQRGREKRLFWQALMEENPYVDQSLYSLCLDPYLDRFPSEQICIITSEELFFSPHTGWLSILDFLGAPTTKPSGIAYNVSTEKRQFTGPMLWLWERDLLRPRRIPRPLKALGRRLLLRNNDQYRILMQSSDGKLPAHVEKLLQQDAIRLESRIGQPLWPQSDGHSA